jgi:DNA-directed RNA polymerase subunit beta'
VASNIAANSSFKSRYDGVLEIDELRTVVTEEKDAQGRNVEVVVGRLAEMRIIDPKTKMMLTSANIAYGSKLYFSNGDTVKKGDLICEWDPFNAVVVTEVAGKARFNNVIDGVTCRKEVDAQSGNTELIITESKDRTKAPEVEILDANKQVLRTYALPVGANVMISDGDEVKVGQILVKIPRSAGGAGDITGGLPRVTELFEARNPSNPAVVSEIDGEVTFGKVKRGNREISVTSKLGEVKKYLVPLSKQILVQENDYVRAGTPLSDGAITPSDILNIMGPTAVQEYIVNEVQDVYRLQGVKINDKHIEVIVRQMLRRVKIADPGDTPFIRDEQVERSEMLDENDKAIAAGKRPATYENVLLGITKASLSTDSFISAASFQETTRVLTEAAIMGKKDELRGLKENVIVGRLIPAGTGLAYHRTVKENEAAEAASYADFNTENAEEATTVEAVVAEEVPVAE